MTANSIYINLEDSVAKIASRLKQTPFEQLVLVCPRRCVLFSSPDNLIRLKQESESLGKEIVILTMDEKGQTYAKAAGFGLVFLTKEAGSKSLSDIRPLARRSVPDYPAKEQRPTAQGLGGLKSLADKIIPKTSVEFVKSKPKTEEFLKAKISVKETFYPSFKPDHKRPPSRRTGRIVTGFIAITLILALLLVFVVLPKATVVVYAKSEAVTRDMEISLAPSLSEPDINRLALPATQIQETVSLTDKFSDTGKKQVGGKASGTVRIYNFTKSFFNLKAVTTSLQVGGKTYLLTKDVMGVRPTVYKNPSTKEVDQSSLGEPVAITAANGGEDYNLPAGTRMEISNQVFGSKPLYLYAKTDTELSGGTTRYISVISQEDVNSSQAALLNKALLQVRDKISKEGLVLPEGAYLAVKQQFVTDNAVGTETPTFTASMQIKILGIAFKNSDFSNLIFNRISQTISSNKILPPFDQKQVSYKVKTFDQGTYIAVLSVHYQGLAVYNLDIAGISSQLAGKSQNEVEEILRSKPEIDRVEVTLAPSWQRKFPYFSNKILVQKKVAGTE